MTHAHTLGFPRMGAQRELKFALEGFWRGERSEAQLRETGRALRQRHWAVQREAGLAQVSTGDFAWYDTTLTLAATLGALPARFGFDARRLTLAQYFELARGRADQPAMEMTKWFDTNYHYLVPELGPDTTFEGGVDWWFHEVDEALAQGLTPKPVVLGPISFLWLSKVHGAASTASSTAASAGSPGGAGFDRLSLLPRLVQAYRRILAGFAQRGVQWVQIDEPVLCLDLPADWLAAFQPAYDELATPGLNLLLATYFDTAADHAVLATQLPVQGFHIDLVRAPQQLDAWLAALPPQAVLSVGVVDGRNIWRSDLDRILAWLAPLKQRLGERLWIAPSCSLLHVPVSLDHEVKLDAEVRSWLAFATEKLGELQVLAQGLSAGRDSVVAALQANAQALVTRRASGRVTNPVVQKRLQRLTAEMSQRHSPFVQRQAVQREALQLPPLPTTTIGSFPQTQDIRQARAAWRRGELSATDYLQRMRAEIEAVVRKQEALGLDVLVHGEAERNDMVEYFGEQLWGYAFTDNGWVQSYGSRCVKPPVLYGDVFRPEAMTVETTRYAQSLTDRPMKGMLTGPVTMLQWSFVRDDQPRETTALQLALAIRDEVSDLEQAGIRIVQIDEPAFREGLPLRRAEWPRYLDWAVRAFKVSACSVRDDTQIHTHMCYSEFNDILPAIAELDADVITIETSRSDMELLQAFEHFDYPNQIGPGVYDIHSPTVPTQAQIEQLMRKAAERIPAERLWVNPDCGLKTRQWAEVIPALRHMVAAARALRQAHDPAAVA